jgi:TolB-like protein/DNA-binding winged helix-turn-helix (wHTH) protein/tetratricopeptide (TPR) repeat protein
MSKQGWHLYEFGPFRLDPLERKLTRSGTLLPLTPKAFDTLCALVENSGQTMDKDALLRRVWPGTFVEEATLAQNIFTLRKTLGGNVEGEVYIETVPRRGYRFVASVQVFASSPPDTKQVSSAANVAGDATQNRTQLAREAAKQVRAMRASALRSLRLWMGIFGLCLILWIVWIAWGHKVTYKIDSREPILVAGHAIQSIVVLPFTNLSGDPNQEYLADGMTDALITDLAKINYFRVISRTTSMHYKGSQKSLMEIARELGSIDAVVEGSVFRSGSRVTVTAQLILANTDQHIWADRFEQDFGEIAALQANLAGAVIRRLATQSISMKDRPIERLEPMDPQAEEAYLRGRYELGQETLEANQLAIQYFRRAIQIEAGNPLAYVGMAEAHHQAILFGTPPGRALPLARAAASKALQLDNNIAEAHSLMGLAKIYMDRDWQGANAEFKLALQLKPGAGSVHWQYASAYLQPMGKSQEALAEFRKALEFDPLSPLVNARLGWQFFFAGQYDDAIEQFHKTLELDPNFTVAHWGLMETYEQKNLYSEAVKAFQRTEASIMENPEFIDSIGTAYTASGVNGYWQKRLEACLTHQQHGNPETGVELAIVYAQLGQKDRAFQSLRMADLELDTRLILLNIEPKLELLRDDPRFEELRKRLKLPAH